MLKFLKEKVELSVRLDSYTHGSVIAVLRITPSLLHPCRFRNTHTHIAGVIRIVIVL